MNPRKGFWRPVLLGCLGAALGLGLAGCLGEAHNPSRSGQAASGASAADRANCATVCLFFATDRQEISTPRSGLAFGGARSSLRFGTCRVTIPEDPRWSRTFGRMESPRLWKLEWRAQAPKQVVLADLTVEAEADFHREFSGELAGLPRKTVLLFVHGYNVPFDSAARGAAQFAYDLAFQGVPVLYSWPSEGKLLSYPTDEANVEFTLHHFRPFLKWLLAQSGADKVYIVAHSMGNRAVTRGMELLLSRDPELAGRVGELILAAPDVDASVFKEQIAPVLAESHCPTTLYASSRDKALGISRRFHSYQRAGQTRPEVVVAEGVQTIDVSAVDDSFLGHSYVNDNSSVLTDIYYLIHQDLPPSQRKDLRSARGPEGTYWVFVRPKR